MLTFVAVAFQMYATFMAAFAAVVTVKNIVQDIFHWFFYCLWFSRWALTSTLATYMVNITLKNRMDAAHLKDTKKCFRKQVSNFQRFRYDTFFPSK